MIDFDAAFAKADDALYDTFGKPAKVVKKESEIEHDCKAELHESVQVTNPNDGTYVEQMHLEILTHGVFEVAVGDHCHCQDRIFSVQEILTNDGKEVRCRVIERTE